MADPSLEQFLQGTPERFVQADATPKILVFWPHGHERLGPRLGHHIFTLRPDLLEHVDYLCGNPLAAAKVPPEQQVEADLNRSFGKTLSPASYEEHRALEVLRLISDNSYDFVLDMHTTRTSSEKCLIINRRNPVVDTIVAASTLKKVVVLPDSIASAGLIGQTDNSVSVEYNDVEADERGVSESVALIEGLIDPELKITPFEREFYYVTRTVPVSEDPGEVTNFELCPDNYYPILFGPNTYKTDPTKLYLGFAASTKEVTVL